MTDPSNPDNSIEPHDESPPEIHDLAGGVIASQYRRDAVLVLADHPATPTQIAERLRAPSQTDTSNRARCPECGSVQLHSRRGDQRHHNAVAHDYWCKNCEAELQEAEILQPSDDDYPDPTPDGGVDPVTSNGRDLVGRRVRIDWGDRVDTGVIVKVADRQDRFRELGVRVGEIVKTCHPERDQNVELLPEREVSA